MNKPTHTGFVIDFINNENKTYELSEYDTLWITKCGMRFRKKDGLQPQKYRDAELDIESIKPKEK